MSTIPISNGRIGTSRSGARFRSLAVADGRSPRHDPQRRSGSLGRYHHPHHPRSVAVVFHVVGVGELGVDEGDRARRRSRHGCHSPAPDPTLARGLRPYGTRGCRDRTPSARRSRRRDGAPRSSRRAEACHPRVARRARSPGPADPVEILRRPSGHDAWSGSLAILVVADQLAPLALGTLSRRLPDGEVGHEPVGAAPCQCHSPGGVWTVSPARISRTSPPRAWIRPTPSVTWTICPTAWACQALRALARTGRHSPGRATAPRPWR